MEDNILVGAGLVPTVEETRTLEDYLAEVMRLRGEIEGDQADIERLKADNRELKAETRVMLSTLKATFLT